MAEKKKSDDVRGDIEDVLARWSPIAGGAVGAAVLGRSFRKRLIKDIGKQFEGLRVGEKIMDGPGKTRRATQGDVDTLTREYNIAKARETLGGAALGGTAGAAIGAVPAIHARRKKR